MQEAVAHQTVNLLVASEHPSSIPNCQKKMNYALCSILLSSPMRIKQYLDKFFYNKEKHKKTKHVLWGIMIPKRIESLNPNPKDLDLINGTHTVGEDQYL